MLRKTSLLLACSLLATALAHAAPDEAACCLNATSRLESLLNPVSGSDEDFFTSNQNTVPNVLLMLDTSGSMFYWPFAWGNTPGCGHPVVNSIAYDPNVTNPPEWNNINSETRYSEWFRPTGVYQILDCDEYWGGDCYGESLSSAPNGGRWTGGSRDTNITNACSGVDDPALCGTCLKTRGYYTDNDGDDDDDRIMGNLLNIYAPRYLMLRHVVKDVIKDIRRVRMALGAFSSTGGGDPVMVSNFAPSCDQFDNQSSWDSNRQSLVSKIDKVLDFGLPRTPLFRSLFLSGFMFDSATQSRYDADFPNWRDEINVSGWGGWNFQDDTVGSSCNGSPCGFKEVNSAKDRAVCLNCNYNAIILLSDGEPNDSYEDSFSAFTPGNEIIWPDCDGSVAAGGDDCRNSDLDEIAKYLAENDMRKDLPGDQAVQTYTIAFGLGSNSFARKLLRHTAEAGKGEYFEPTTSTQLKDSLIQAFQSINNRATSFSSASVGAFQSGSLGADALVPRMFPDQRGAWKGRLFRFEVYNEFVKDTAHPGAGDSDKDDIFIVDSSGAIVSENADGEFIRRGSTTKATPFWEANARLVANGHDGRKIYTVLDTASTPGALTSEDGVVEFTVANVDLLGPYMGIYGTPACPDLATGDVGTILRKLGLGATLATVGALGLSAVSLDQNVLNRLCAAALIAWTRGRDLGDADGDGNRSETRPDVLGDIFHSSPLVIEPPATKFLCDLGLSNQCVRTLYSENLGINHTPLDSYSITECGVGRSVNAYEKYAFDRRTRDRLAVVGANDGMLHAFHNGEGSASCSGGVETRSYDNGTGDEVWAVIPPDQLPRLHERLHGHTYHVDADLMVRDVWHDDNGDGVKQSGEFKTMLVAAEGRGGRHYFGMEVKFNNAGDAVPPDFRWLFPQPCTPEAQFFGKTLFALSPKPPPIGPVLLDAKSLTGYGGKVVDRHGNPNTVERWVAMLSGGWSPETGRGRGVYMVDIYDGQVNGRSDNLLWKWSFNEKASDAQHVSQKHMTHGIVAPVAMADYGDLISPRLDGFFDTAVVGDTGGQLWVFRMFQAGKVSNSAPFLVDNWYGGRAFEQDRDATGFFSEADGGTYTSKSDKNRWPFHYIASLALQPETGALRAMIGAGNRYAILDKGAGTCRYDNPALCAKGACDEVKIVTRIDSPTIDVNKDEMHWKGTSFAHAKMDVNIPSSPGNFCATPTTASFETMSFRTCNMADGTVKDLNPLRDQSVTCQLTAGGTSYACRSTSTAPTPGGIDPLQDLPTAPITGVGNNRFYGLWVFGGSRVFGPDAGTARDFDDARLSDRTTSDPVAGQLVNVSNTVCTATGCDGGVAASNGYGWFLDYPGVEHRTATGATVLASCALWNSMFPNPDAGLVGGECGTTIGASGAFYQADYLTGAPNCAYSFLSSDGGTYARSITRSVLAPPPEPATAVQVAPDGRIRYSALVVEPGQDQVTQVGVSQNSEALQSIYEIPVSRAEHACRHGDEASCP